MQVAKWNFDAQLGNFFAGKDAGFVFEVAQETSRRNPNFKSAGYQLPLDILAERDLSAGGMERSAVCSAPSSERLDFWSKT
jgi:hypothetical protein